jgi:hypothetical protein
MPDTKSRYHFDIRTTREWINKVDKAARDRNTTKTNLVKSLVDKGLETEGTYPLDKFLQVAPESKCFYLITVKADGDDKAQIVHHGITENLYQELASLPKLREWVMSGAKLTFWEVK